VLRAGHAAAAAAGRVADEAFVLHELGSRAGCLGDAAGATTLLRQALDIRERIGDEAGAELTRHNLAQIAGPPPSINGNGRGPRRPPRWSILGAIAALAVAGVAIALASGGDDQPRQPARASPAKEQRKAHRNASGSPTPTLTTDIRDTIGPSVTIDVPALGATYKAGDKVIVAYSCDDPSGVSVCRGDQANGGALDTTPGTHVFRVEARDRVGNTSTGLNEYSVLPPSGDGEPSATTPTEPSPIR
jgi:hypothetical protein